MSDGRTHTAATLGLSLAYATADWHIALWILGGIFLSPDLDVEKGYIGFFYLRKIFPPLYYFWRYYWFLYSKFVPHRSWISHSPIISTLIRVAYLMGPFELVYYYYWGTWFPIPMEMLRGLVFSDILHIVMDFFNYPKRPSDFGASDD